MNLAKLVTALSVLILPHAVLAAAITDIPEPSSLALLGIGGAAAVAIAVRRRRNKK
jgi:hypothetical protein